MLVKICGITDPEMAKVAALAGADFIGILFSSLSPRSVSIKRAKEIARAARLEGAEVIGVFVDEELEEILQIVKELDLHYVQLHGDRSRRALDALPKELQIIYVVDERPLPKGLARPLTRREVTALYAALGMSDPAPDREDGGR